MRLCAHLWIELPHAKTFEHRFRADTRKSVFPKADICFHSLCGLCFGSRKSICESPVILGGQCKIIEIIIAAVINEPARKRASNANRDFTRSPPSKLAEWTPPELRGPSDQVCLRSSWLRLWLKASTTGHMGTQLPSNVQHNESPQLT